MVYPDSDKCIVDWKYDKLHGQATVIYPNGTTYMGEWEDDTFMSKSKPYLANVISCNS